VRNAAQGLLHDLLIRRQELLRDAQGLLRLYELHAQGWLLLLPVHQRQPRLLRLLLTFTPLAAWRLFGRNYANAKPQAAVYFARK
jgi:hypothetical protein